MPKTHPLKTVFNPKPRRGHPSTRGQLGGSIPAIYFPPSPATVTITASVPAPTPHAGSTVAATVVTATATSIAPSAISIGAGATPSVVTATVSVLAPASITGNQDAFITAAVVTATTTTITPIVTTPTVPISLGALAWWDGSDPEADGTPPTDGTSPASWTDRTANAHNLTTKSGGATYESNELNGLGIMRFDGVDDGYSNSSPFMFSNGTIEIWAVVKSDESGTGSVINECHSTQNGQAYRLTDDDTNNDFGFNFDNSSNTTRFNNTQDRRTNTWDLVIATDKGAAGGTINEVVGVDLGSTGAYTRDATTFNRLAVGYMPRATPAQFFDGDIAEIIVFSSQRSDADRATLGLYLSNKWGQSWSPGSVTVSAPTVTVTASVPSAAAGMNAVIMALNPLGYWKLDETSGTNAVDSSPNARNGTYQGTFTLQTWSGPYGTSYADFGGGRVTIVDNNVWSANNASGLTVVAFIRPETAELTGTTRKIFVSKSNTSNHEWQMAMSNGVAGRLIAEMFNSTGSDISNEFIDSTLTAGQWNFVAFATASPVFDQRFDLYSNGGSPVSSSKATNTNSTYTNGTAAVNIGYRADSPASNSWNGGIAHVAIFAGKLTSTQVGSIYSAAQQDGWV